MANIIGFAGYSNSGKTTLIAKVVSELQRRGYTAAVLKHDAHGHYKEAEGSDSGRFIRAGADAVVTVSPDAVHTYEKKREPRLRDIIGALPDVDYILIEGFKTEKHRKIAVFRTAEQSRIVGKLDPEPIAAATDLPDIQTGLPLLNLNDAAEVTDFIVAHFQTSNIKV